MSLSSYIMIGKLRGILIGSLVLSGCASNLRQLEILESHLRTQEEKMQGLQQTMQKKDSELRNTREQLAFYQKQCEVQSAVCFLPEQSQSLFSIQSLRIDPLHTGFVMQDQDPLNSKLNVVVTPFDDAGEIIRVPGTVELIVKEKEGNTEIGRWSYDIHETAQSWLKSFTISGFQFFLPVKCNENITFVIESHFVTTDKRTFKSTHTVKCTDLLDPMPRDPADSSSRKKSNTNEPGRLETSVNWEKDDSPVFR